MLDTVDGDVSNAGDAKLEAALGMEESGELA